MREAGRLVAAAIAAVLVGRAFLLAGSRAQLVATTVVVAGFVINGLVLWSEGAVTLAAAALAIEYFVALDLSQVAVDPFVPLAAVLLVAFIEVADLAISIPPDTAVDMSFVRARLSATAGVATIAVVASVATLGLAVLPLPESTLTRVVALLGAAAAVVASVALLRGAAGAENPSGSSAARH